MERMPRHSELMWPTLEAIRSLGASATNAEIVQRVIKREGFSEDIQKEMHKNGPMTRLEYKMFWARTYLKKYGALENSQRGVWSITDIGEGLTQKEVSGIATKISKINYEKRKRKRLLEEKDSDSDTNNDVDWKAELLDVLQNKISPNGFERLVQRILRESGFIEVEVTGKSGDGRH